ncbi:pyridoxamine 5'-phosphate oxidase family protein [bacterium]|nr:pyridoxamine 5'-phosphate oxidase family protein [bacterium]
MAKYLFESQNLGVIATLGKEFPYCSLIAFAATDDLMHIIFATLRNTRKYSNIKAYPTISMLIDTRSNRVEDFKDAIALTILGIAREAEGEERERLSRIYLARHPYLREFILNPECALMAIEAERYILVNRFQQVMEMDIAGRDIK